MCDLIFIQNGHCAGRFILWPDASPGRYRALHDTGAAALASRYL
jgi:hypothetical protein